MKIRIVRLIKSFSYAFRGIWKVFKEEQNLRIQSFIALAVIILAIFLRINRQEWIALVIVIGVVVLAETINSAVERVTDVLKPRIHTYVKEIKDIMAAAVMLASIMAVIIGILIFWPYFT